MSLDKTTRQNRIREALGRIYDQQPPYFREYLRRYKEDPKSRVFAPLAEAYRRVGRIDEAIEICLEGLQHHPNFHGGRVALAKCYLEKKRYQDARSELERVVQSVPENLLAQRLLGEAQLQLGNEEAALHCFKMALLMSPNDVTLAEKVHQIEKRQSRGTLGKQTQKPATPPPAAPPSVAKKNDAFTDEDSKVLEQMLVDDNFSPDTLGNRSMPMPPSPTVSELWGVESNEISVAPVGSNEPVVSESAELSDVENVSEMGLDEFEEIAVPYAQEEDEAPTPEIDAILASPEEATAEDSFKVEHISDVFQAEAPDVPGTEITTETLGDLYFSQGQYDQALMIFEKIAQKKKTPELQRKIAVCRGKMGVDRAAIVRSRQITLLRSILSKVQQSPLPP